MKNVFETTVLSWSGLKTSSETKKAIQNRSNIFIMSDAAEDAVLRPKEYVHLIMVCVLLWQLALPFKIKRMV